ncbi:MAG: Bacterial regulatory protein arsR family, partial [Acidimicrobiaceae bacterium]|nr:Bacterial regulatory protein arsR family [Acidimicrobiaceae bacterium]
MGPVAILQALGEPNRHAIVELLRDGERPVGELVEQLHLSQPAV